MVALLVLATFVTFILVDVLLNREKYAFRVTETPETRPVPGHEPVPVVAGVALPETLAYHPGHAWALNLGHGRVRVGLDGFAASLLGSSFSIETPKRGRWLRQGERGWSITTPKGEVQMLAPAEGEIVAVNEKALSDPGSVAADPYGKGWLLEIFSPDTEVSFRNLLTGHFATRWMEESMRELRAYFGPGVPATAMDGGHMVANLGDDLTPEQWQELTHEFFRS